MDPINLLPSGLDSYAMASFFTFIGCFIALPTLLAILRFLGVYIVVEERQCLSTFCSARCGWCSMNRGSTFPFATDLSWRALFVNFFGDVRVVDLRLDQEYLRSQPVNSEEGAPMGIGVWYEMWISDPVAYLFKNADPRGSLRANVSNATVRNLSNLKLANMLEDRHSMSTLVRDEVSDKSKDWGYSLGSGLRAQGSFPRREHDPADRGESGEPPAAGDLGDPAGRHEPGQPDREHGGAAGGGRVRQGGGDAALHRGQRAQHHRAGQGSGQR